MSGKRIATIVVGAALFASGCANSVLNDPEEMARRRALAGRGQLCGRTSQATQRVNSGAVGRMMKIRTR
ncbi:MAG: hypothetical protein HLUCCA12_16125 [Rhodobacteraceae bacterium HLUCCA12]|nr:MAG: hypothetical protein HLUCCA12_16125 [Rhodobacteraceae bacterium HLUCCA12]